MSILRLIKPWKRPRWTSLLISSLFITPKGDIQPYTIKHPIKLKIIMIEINSSPFALSNFLLQDQGSQFTSQDFTEALKASNIKISMDGKGRWMDNVFIERIWRSLKYECIYLCEFETVRQSKQGIENYFDFYNTIRPHKTFDGQTPDYIYTQGQSVKRTQQLAA